MALTTALFPVIVKGLALGQAALSQQIRATAFLITVAIYPGLTACHNTF